MSSNCPCIQQVPVRVNSEGSRVSTRPTLASGLTVPTGQRCHTATHNSPNVTECATWIFFTSLVFLTVPLVFHCPLLLVTLGFLFTFANEGVSGETIHMSPLPCAYFPGGCLCSRGGETQVEQGLPTSKCPKYPKTFFSLQSASHLKLELSPGEPSLLLKKGTLPWPEGTLASWHRDGREHSVAKKPNNQTPTFSDSLS